MKTLWDSIEDKEKFKQVVLDAVTKAMADLGDKVYDIEWFNISKKDLSRYRLVIPA